MKKNKKEVDPKIVRIQERQANLEEFTKQFESLIEPIKKSLGKGLEAKMKENGFNKNQVHKKTNYAHNEISKLFKGENNPTIEKLFQFVHACEVKITIEENENGLCICFK